MASNDPNVVVQRRRESVQKGVMSERLQFPMNNSGNEIESNYTIISFYEYTRVNPLAVPKEEPNGHIILPIPFSGLVDNTNVDFSEMELGVIGGTLKTLGSGSAATQKAGGLLAGLGIAGAGAIAKTVAQNLGEFAATKLGATSRSAAGAGKQAGEFVDKYKGLVSGEAINPNITLNFKGVKLREHTFTWRLIAKDADESKAIENILIKLRQMALPKMQGGGAIALSYPYIASIEFFPAIIKISDLKCFISDIRISYDGVGHPSFYRDTSAPVVIDLSITFKERAILTSDDYGR